jgi:hypothetical protein
VRAVQDVYGLGLSAYAVLSDDPNLGSHVMSPVTIPGWNANGIIPPANPSSPVSADRSPYPVSLVDLVLRFATSPDRRRILDGFLRYRQRLHFAGLLDGFQWIDGSFLENIEVLERRPPNDLDVVTFFRIPAGADVAAMLGSAPDAFPLDSAARVIFKARFFLDAHLVRLDQPPERLVTHTTYWYSMWSHRRNGLWKGYLQVDLAATEDVVAASHLGTSPTAGGTP